MLICIIFWEETFGKWFRTSAAHLSAGLKHCSKTQKKKLLSNYASAPNMGGNQNVSLIKGDLLIATPVTWELLDASESPTMVPQVPLMASRVPAGSESCPGCWWPAWCFPRGRRSLWPWDEVLPSPSLVGRWLGFMRCQAEVWVVLGEELFL